MSYSQKMWNTTHKDVHFFVSHWKVVRVIPYSAVQLLSYEAYKVYFENCWWWFIAMFLWELSMWHLCPSSQSGNLTFNSLLHCIKVVFVLEGDETVTSLLNRIWLLRDSIFCFPIPNWIWRRLHLLYHNKQRSKSLIANSHTYLNPSWVCVQFPRN